ncbi:acetyl-CoA carboxylase biotin carboxyl carrier protein subunit [Fluviispira multicolorata]|uniref:Biotin/lipoyl-binding protein n=1 Tax=Fluviispira multicolorata TaxID=2654512 RepID=A0A833JB08_9BACT|nr:acetyl-CoA carboxylase biotin carboxyl carrier protein subunit [Fluviispira multicolorata]KAB8028538.1 biotin/lipoyl-binding protein [Fluviispira multicolorata]
MKMNVQKNSDSKNFQVEIPCTTDLTHLANGDFFSVTLSEENDNPKNYSVCLLADGRSYLIDNKIVRVEKIKAKKRNDIYRIAIKNNGILTQNYFHVTALRSVTPRISPAILGGGEIKSPMTGKIVSILIENNSLVKEGDTLIIIEAMKMENRIFAECDGKVTNLSVNAGNNVSAGDMLLSLIPAQ